MTATEKDLARINAFANASPIARWLGFSAAIEEAGILYHLTFDDKHIGNPVIRALHGGAIAAFLEVAAQCELHTALPVGATAKTLNIDIDYLRSSRAEDMYAHVKILRLGRRLAFIEAAGWQQNEEQPVAVARFRFRTDRPISD